MLKMTKSFMRDEGGLEMVEWSIVAALITTAAMLTFTSISGEVSNQLSVILSALQAG